MKSISTINPAITENMECMIIKVLALVIETQCIITLHFVSSSSNVWLTFQAKNNARSTSACTIALHLPTPRTEAIMCVPQIITYVVREKEMEYKGEQRWALVEPWYKHWSCCGWQKGTCSDEVMLNSEEIKPLPKASIELCLSEGISKGVSQSVENSVN